jgi:hypothetical protein
MKKRKFGMSRYSKPTPGVMRKLGDGLLAASTFVTAYAVAEEMKVVALISLVVGAAGKFLTNFFADEEVQ